MMCNKTCAPIPMSLTFLTTPNLTSDVNNASNILGMTTFANMSELETHLNRRSTVEIVLWSTVLVMILMTSLIGNMLVIACVRLHRRLRQENGNLFLINLSVTDMSSAAVVMGSSLHALASDRWHLGSVWCDIVCGVNYTLIIVSMLTLCFIALDRYMAVIHALHYQIRVTPRKIYLLVAYAWFQGLCFGIAPILARWIKYDYWEIVCAIVWHTDSYVTLIYVIVAFAVCFFLPGVVLVIAYYKVMKVAKKHNNVHPQRPQFRPHVSIQPDLNTTDMADTPTCLDRQQHPHRCNSPHHNKEVLYCNGKPLEDSISQASAKIEGLTNGFDNATLSKAMPSTSTQMEEQLAHQSQLESESDSRRPHVFSGDLAADVDEIKAGYQQVRHSADSSERVVRLGQAVSTKFSAVATITTVSPHQRVRKKCNWAETVDKQFQLSGDKDSEKRHRHISEVRQQSEARLLSPGELELTTSSENWTFPVSQSPEYVDSNGLTSPQCAYEQIRHSPTNSQNHGGRTPDRLHDSGSQKFDRLAQIETEPRSQQTSHGRAPVIPLADQVAPATTRPKSSQARHRASDSSNRRNYSASSKAVKSLLIVVLAYFICMTPFSVTKLYKVIVQEEDALPGYVNLVSSVFQFCSSAINPLIYGIFRKDFQAAFVIVFRKLFVKLKITDPLSLDRSSEPY